jgi:23S rRNA pseudouridine1911/1915/1917 synthase
VKRQPGQQGITQLRVGPDDDGERLDVFLAGKFGRSRTQIRNRLTGKVQNASKVTIKWSHRVQTDEVIRVQTIIRPEPEVTVTYRLIYEDEWLVAVDKGPGAPVHPTRSFRTRTIVTRLREDLDQPTLSPVHRLDRETSGVLVFGRTPQTVSRLMKQFAQSLVRKKYLAIVRGSPDFEKICVSEPLGPDPDFPISCRVKVDRENGRPATTDFEVLSRHSSCSLVAARPGTGRQHQIRVHSEHLGHPILGDKLYQEQGLPYLAMIDDSLDDEMLARLGHVRQALHAKSLTFQHPHTEEELCIRAPLPEELQALLI